MGKLVSTLLLLSLAACAQRVANDSGGECTAISSAQRLGPDSIGGIPLQATLASVAHYCRGARLDTVAPGGYTALAIQIPLAHVTLWAVSDSEPYTTRIDSAQRTSFWYAEGDSLRFPNGQLVPRNVGEFRQRFPGALLRADNVDDTEGSYIIECGAPHVAFILGQRPELDDTAASRLDARPLPDSMTFWKIRVDSAGSPPDPALQIICHRREVT
jgi:hypothetical protein